MILILFVTRKKLCEEILAAYPTLTDDEAQSLIPKKEAISVMKIVTHSGHSGKVYCVAKVPMFFQLESLHQALLPTIFTLWHYPNLLRTFTTYAPVVSKLASGADLMLPGVIVKEPITLYSFGKLQKGTPVSINTDDNQVHCYKSLFLFQDSCKIIIVLINVSLTRHQLLLALLLSAVKTCTCLEGMENV